jgi:hypothetical protein
MSLSRGTIHNCFDNTAENTKVKENFEKFKIFQIASITRYPLKIFIDVEIPKNISFYEEKNLKIRVSKHDIRLLFLSNFNHQKYRPKSEVWVNFLDLSIFCPIFFWLCTYES